MPVNSNIALYRRASASAHPISVTTVEKLIEDIRSGVWEEPATRVANEKDAKARRRLKAQILVGFTPTGVQQDRKAELPFESTTGLVALDLDIYKVDEGGEQEALRVRDVMAATPYCVAAFISPSREGVKALFRVEPVPHGQAEHKLAWLATCKWAQEMLGLEPTTKGTDPPGNNISHLQFVSYDPAAYINMEAEGLRWQTVEQPALPPAPVKPPPKRTREYSEAEVQRMLEFCNPDGDLLEYKFKIARAIRTWDGGGNRGLGLWMTWARRGTRSPYPDEEYERFYTQAEQAGAKVTVGTLVKFAKDGGYRVDGLHVGARDSGGHPAVNHSGVTAGDGPRYRHAHTRAHDDGVGERHLPSPGQHFFDASALGWDSDGSLAHVFLRHCGNTVMSARRETRDSPMEYVLHWLCADGVWEPLSADMKATFVDVLESEIVAAFEEERGNPKQLHKVLHRVRSDAGQNAILAVMTEVSRERDYGVVHADYADLNQSSDCIGLDNGVWNLRTGQRVEPAEARKALLTQRLPVRYEPDAPRTEIVDTALASYGQGADLFLAYLGRALYGEPGEVFLLVFGPPDAGKGTIIEALKSILGDACASFIPDALMSASSNRSHNANQRPFFTSRLAYSEEVGTASFGSAITAPSVLKGITGGASTLSFGDKGLAFRSIKVTATVLMTANSIPEIGLNDNAVAKRLRIFENRKHETVMPEVKSRLRTLNSPEQLDLFRLIMEAARDNPPGTPRVDDHSERPAWMFALLGDAKANEEHEFESWLRPRLVQDSGDDPAFELGATPYRVQVKEIERAWLVHNGRERDEKLTECGGVKLGNIAVRIRKGFGLPQTKSVKNTAGVSARGWIGWRLLSDDVADHQPGLGSCVIDSQTASAAHCATHDEYFDVERGGTPTSCPQEAVKKGGENL